jgi:dTDP-4-amino-4,6-dideoxygalactose transaminase
MINLNEKKGWWKPHPLNNQILKEINNTIKNNHVTFGKNSILLENKLKKILKVKNVILCTSGTSALYMATLASNIASRGKVFSAIMTWSGAINGPLFARKKIDFIDNKINSTNADYKKILDKLNKDDVLYLTHLNGKCGYDRKIFDTLKKKKLFVIEDASQALLAKDFKNNYLGTKFDIGCFSLSYTKMLNMIYGGFCVTNNKDIAQNLRTIRNNGVDNDLQIASSVGGNFKPNDVNVMFGLNSIDKIHQIKSKLIKIYRFYKKNLNNKNIKLIKFDNLKNEFPTYIEVLTNNRKKLINYLKAKNIGCSYSIRSLHLSKHLKITNKFKNASNIDKQILRLPSGPGYSIAELSKIIRYINKF